MTFKRIFLLVLVFFILTPSVVIAQTSANDKKVLRVGVLSYRSVDITKKEWLPTIELLEKNIPEYQFELVPFYYSDFDKTMANGGLDFLLTNPEHFVLHRTRYGFSSIATLMPAVSGYPTAHFGGVIFTRADQSNIKDISDIKGKKVASPSNESFAGYLLQTLTLSKQNIAIKDVNITYTGMPHDKVVSLVLAGTVDVGFVRTGVLESMIAEHKISAESIKVINRQKYADFELMVSTELYPEWPFAVRNSVPIDITKKVARAILAIEPNTFATNSAHYYGFAPPLDYTAVEAIMQKLRIHPDFENNFDISDIIEKFYKYIIGMLAFLFSGAFVMVFVYRNQLNRISKQKSQIEAISNNIPNGFTYRVNIFKNGHKQFIHMSDGIKKLLGYDVQDLLNDAEVLYSSIAPEDQDKIAKERSRALLNPQNLFSVDLKMIDKDGNTKWASFNSVQTFACDMYVTFDGVVTDITKLKIYENQLQELVTSETTKRLEKEKLLIQQSKMATMGEMIGAIAHQWRQPLNSLALSIQDVEIAYSLKELSDEYVSKFKTSSMQTIKQMSSTIEDFRKFFSPNKKVEDFLIEDAISESLKILESQLKIHNIEVIQNTDVTKYHSYTGYKNELKQVLLNIFSNAKDAILEKKPAKAFVKIDVIKLANNKLEISIEDSAGGIPEDIIDKIFESYFTTKEDKGTGIGLYMSKQIVEESMNGKLHVSNTENGARFVVELRS